MSADVALEELDVDLEENRVHASLSLDVDELFDEHGELRLWEDETGWSGFVREGDGYHYRNTWRAENDPLRQFRVGERSVQLAVQERIEDEDIGGVGTFVRRAEP